MRKKLCLLLSGLAAISLWAQDSYTLIKENNLRAYGNMFPYVPASTLAPKPAEGFELFYISHFSRHGSRYDIDSTYRHEVVKELEALHRQGKLTEKGEQLFSDLMKMRALTDGNNGELTSLGGLEHRGIAARMYEHYPELFNGKVEIQTYTTMVKRVIESRNHFMDALLNFNPELCFKLDYLKENSWNRQEVQGRDYTPEEWAALSNDKACRKIMEERWAKVDASHFANSIFKNPKEVPQAKELMYKFYFAIKTSACLDGAAPDFIGYFTPDELYELWWRSNMSWFMHHGITMDNGGVRALVKGKPMTEAIIKDAEDVIAGRSKAKATLRFGHDGELNPLLCYMDIEGSNCLELSQVAEQARDFELVCTAGNVQLLFYRNSQGKVLVTVLHNEKPSRVGTLEPYCGLFYEWEKLRDYWTERDYMAFLR